VPKKKHLRRKETWRGASLSSRILSRKHVETTATATVAAAKKDHHRDCRGGKEYEPVRCFCFVVCCSLSILRMIFLLSSHHISKFLLSAVTTTVFFLSVHFFSLTRDSFFFFFFFFFRVLDVPFALVSKKQGREKDSGVLYASSSFPRRRFCWRRR
jgi:hypothetical protein